MNTKSYNKRDILLQLLDNNQDLISTQYNFYTNIHDDSGSIIRDITVKDGGKLFLTTIAIANLTQLGSSINTDEKLEQEILEIGEKLNKTREDESGDNECGEIVMSKRYVELDELIGDDDEAIYFDKKYDPTRYDILDNLDLNIGLVDENTGKEMLVDHLKTNVGMNDNDANIEAAALIAGKRLVTDGVYALLDRDGDKNYYVRRDNRWRLVEEMRNKNIDDLSFCNLKNKCLNIKNKCDGDDANREKLKKNLVEEILRHYEGKNEMELSALTFFMQNKLVEATRVLPLLDAINHYEKRKNDMYKIQLGLLYEDTEKVISPKQKLFDAILSIDDFADKQSKIIRFVDKYCRQNEFVMDSAQPESEYWYYCIATNIPLVPTFFYILAQAYFDEQYSSKLDEICAERGTKSDDGNMIVDKHSGYIIRQLELEELEGFDATGRPLSSYDLLQRDRGDVVLDVINMAEEELYRDKNAQTISRVVSTLDISMGISTKSQHEFVIRHTIKHMTHELKSKQQYDIQVAKMKKRGRRMMPYDNYVNEFLLFWTLSYYLVGIQTMNPSVQSVKTFGTGCKKSFTGFPLDPMGDMSSLEYLACVAMNLKSDAQPWNVLPSLAAKVKAKIKNKGKEARVVEEKKLTESVVNKIKVLLEKKILKEQEVIDKFAKKRLIVETMPEEDISIPMSIDVKGWSTFLPPLVTQPVEHLHNINETFKNLLVQEISTGNPQQFDRMNKLYGMMLYHSLAIQESIQGVVNKVSMILKNKGTNVPYLENACCSDGTINTYNYFTDADDMIDKNNKKVHEMQIFYNGVREIIIAPYLFSEEDTKMKYTILGNSYGESTIYHAFVYFCKNNIQAIQNEAIRGLCGDIQPVIDSDEFSYKTLYIEIEEFFEKLGSKNPVPDPIISRIEILKKNGFNFTNDALVNLFNSVNKTRIVENNTHNVIVSAKHALEGVVTYLKEKKEPNVCGEGIIRILENLMDRFYVEYSEASDSAVLDLLGYIKEFNANTIEKILQTIGTTKQIHRDVRDFIREINPSQESKGTYKQNVERKSKFIMNWKTRGENILMNKRDETAFNASEYIKICVKNISKVYPNIIINKESYKNKTIPQHWKLDKEFHINDIKEIIASEYSSLEQFFGDNDILPILNNIINKSDDIIMLMNATPFFAENENQTIINGEILKELMFFYLLCILNMYVDSTREIEISLDNIKSDDEEEMESQVEIATSLEEELLEGRRQERQSKLNELVYTLLVMMQKYKVILDYSNEDIVEKVLKAKEKEKNKITKRLGDLTPEEREIENIMKNQRLGDWGLGQTKALFIYDDQQYNKERRELERDAVIEFQLGQNDAVTDMNREIYKLDALEEMAVASRIEREEYGMFNVAEDDDNGDNDDVYRIDYGDM